MKITPVNKIPYNGPKTHHAILKKIHEEAMEQKKDISFNYIERTVYLFFGDTGFPYYFKTYKSFSILGLGKWIISRKIKFLYRRSLKRKKDLKIKRTNVQTAHSIAVKRFHKKNALLTSNNLKPWDWTSFCKAYGYKKFISWGIIPFRHKIWKPRDFLPLRK